MNNGTVPCPTCKRPSYIDPLTDKPAQCEICEEEQEEDYMDTSRRNKIRSKFRASNRRD